MTTKTVWYLQMTAQDQFTPASTEKDFKVKAFARPTGEEIRRLWMSVGEPQQWTSRIEWTAQQWSDLAADENTKFWVGQTAGRESGFFELRVEGTDVQIHFLGLFPKFIGRGYGGHLLNEAVNNAWALGAERVYLQTNSRDHDHALANYLGRGFQIYDTVEKDI